MYKVYNNQIKISSDIANFLKKVFPNIRKTQLNIIPFIFLGMNLAESVVASDIAKELKGDFSLVQFDSVIKRIRRFFKNKHFNPYDFYDGIIRFVINNYRLKHNDNRVHIILDHMFSHDNYTVFMISMRIGKSGIPLWFRAFEGRDCPDAFKEELLKQGISYVSSLFKENNKNFDLIFLADRWFNSTSLMEYINTLGHTYIFRLKKNFKVFIFDKKEGHYIWNWLDNLRRLKNHPVYYNDIYFTESKYISNIVISSSKKTNDPWILITNGDSKRAIKDYSYRFGGIETIFKNQKSNGFYLEKTVNASLKYFESLYALACFSILYNTILGADYIKNSKSYKNVKITTHTISNGKKTRVLSLFNTGLILFHLAFNSSRYIRLPFSFILYDV